MCCYICYHLIVIRYPCETSFYGRGQWTRKMNLFSALSALSGLIKNNEIATTQNYFESLSPVSTHASCSALLRIFARERNDFS